MASDLSIKRTTEMLDLLSSFLCAVTEEQNVGIHLRV
jgi:hypothetical protein